MRPAAHGIETKYAGAKINAEKTDAGVFTGYASLFNEVDLGRDALAPGAFSKALSARSASGVRMLFQHDPDAPIGVWDSITEDKRGLHVQGRLALDTVKGREVWELLRIGAVDGLSIGFKTVRAKADPQTGVRTITEADLWEISVVTFPMLPSARVDAVKQARLPSIREFERLLVRDAGLSRSEAKRTVTQGYSSVIGSRDASIATTKNTSSDAALAARIREAARQIQTY
ncbi:MAG: HK97 family phage prohead protease [Pseudomonadota bacterium]